MIFLQLYVLEWSKSYESGKRKAKDVAQSGVCSPRMPSTAQIKRDGTCLLHQRSGGGDGGQKFKVVLGYADKSLAVRGIWG